MAVAGKESENGVYEFPYRKREKLSKCERFRTAIWNSATGQFLGRTPKSWGQILLFYSIFYIVLGALFAICMQGLFATIDDQKPKFLMDDGLIGTNPGLGFRPISSRTEEGSRIWYNVKNVSTITKWVQLIDEFLKPYKDVPGNSSRVECDINRPPKEYESCKVNLDHFGPCTSGDDYGYSTSSPCIFLKLNRIYGWVPEYYNDSSNLPKEMPSELQEQIKHIAANNTFNQNTNQVWVSCEGENPADREHSNSREFEYYPSRGFASYYYPYQNTKGYLSPLVAVRVKITKPNVLINIECRAWAKNINYRGGNLQREGSIHFEIMQDV